MSPFCVKLSHPAAAFLFWVFLSLNLSAQSSHFIQKRYLVNLKNEKIRLCEQIAGKPFVLVFYDTDCPICQKYLPILLQEAQKRDSALRFFFVFTKWADKAAIQNWVNENEELLKHLGNSKLSLLCDPKNKLLRHLKATTTPEAFFCRPRGQILYRGAIDNWFFALGQYRPQATEHYLKNAIDAYLKNEKIQIQTTKPIGCLIEP
jgi:thiol-disulfide isomerase/thioredoxin